MAFRAVLLGAVGVSYTRRFATPGSLYARGCGLTNLGAVRIGYDTSGRVDETRHRTSRGDIGRVTPTKAQELTRPVRVTPSTLEPLTAAHPDMTVAVDHERRRATVRMAPGSITGGVATLTFAAMWNIFLVGWYVTALRAEPSIANVALWFPTLHVLVGMYLIYAGLAEVVNRAVVEIAPDACAFRVGPLPIAATWSEPTCNVVAFTDREVVLAGNDGDVLARDPLGAAPATTYRRPPRYTLLAQTRDGRELPLALHFGAEEHARELATQLNGALAAAREPFTYRG
jgi:hypothetical protein